MRLEDATVCRRDRARPLHREQERERERERERKRERAGSIDLPSISSPISSRPLLDTTARLRGTAAASAIGARALLTTLVCSTASRSAPSFLPPFLPPFLPSFLPSFPRELDVAPALAAADVDDAVAPACTAALCGAACARSALFAATSRLVRSWPFDLLIDATLIANAALIAYESRDALFGVAVAADDGGATSVVGEGVEVLFTSIYTLEVSRDDVARKDLAP